MKARIATARCATTNSSIEARWRTSISKDTCRCHPMATANAITARIAPSGISRPNAGVRSVDRCAWLISIDMTLEVYVCAVDVYCCQSVRADALYTPASRSRPDFHRDLTLLCAPARGNVIDAIWASAEVSGELPFRCIDGTEALPYKPPQLSDILLRRRQCLSGSRYCVRVSSGVARNNSRSLKRGKP